MGIGSNTIYYKMYKSNARVIMPLYRMALFGDTYNIRDILNDSRFSWAENLYAWVSKGAFSKDNWNEYGVKLFNKLEKRRYAIEHKRNISNTEKKQNQIFI